MKLTGKENLERTINRLKKDIQELEDKKDSLSKHGYWDLGYYKGQLSVLEMLLDELN